MDQNDLMKEFHRILHNRVLPALVFDSESPEFILYRITEKYEDFNPNVSSCYSYNPNPKCFGRAHKVEFPVFYGALDPLTAITEMKGTLNNGQRFYLSKWRIKFNSEVLIHSLLINSKTIESEHILKPCYSGYSQ